MLFLYLLSVWNVEVVSTSENFFLPPLIAIDSLDNPYILVTLERDTVNYLYYQILFTKSYGSWIADTFETHGTQTADISVDRSFRIWTIYCQKNPIDTTFATVVAHKDVSGWVKDTVVADLSNRQTITTDASGNPHIAYDRMSDLHGYYGYFDGLVWYNEVVDSYVGEIYEPSITLDSQGHPCISYRDDYWEGGKKRWKIYLCYATKMGNIWYSQKVDSTMEDYYTTPTSLAIDNSDLPHIVYNYNSFDLVYIHWDGSNWEIDTLGDCLIATQRAIDTYSAGHPYILAELGGSSLLLYKSDGFWCAETLPLTPTTNFGGGGSLCIGNNGMIHIARIAFGNNNYEIHYLYGRPGGIEEGQKVPMVENLKLKLTPSIVSSDVQIQYIVSDKEYIKLNLYDILGRKITKLMDGYVEPGLYNCSLNLSNLCVGIYFLVLEAENGIVTQKIIVAR